MTLAESILALTVFFIAAAVLLPFCMKLFEETSWRWEKQEGMRKLYEEAESRIFSEASFFYKLDQSTVKGEIVWKETKGKSEACVAIGEKTTCVVEQ
ncbi:hypothetical protein NLX67_13070 [Domibacillus sp. A3M-37]|uniref:hypothetical protein n=1 Tax=Domibacillus TaxID=1433999 RepID=UPI000617C661|nr:MULTISPECIES: hypothetical protein [Domibacillus]MCP3763314.1 hypothetical protein [Domibacillus sp. A3M-37]